MGNAGGHGTSGTRYLSEGASDTGASTTIQTFVLLYDCSITELRWAADAVGSGAGTLTVTFCKVTLPSTITTTSLTFEIDVDVTLQNSVSVPEGTITGQSGDRVTVQVVVNGTVTGSQTRPRAWFKLVPTT
jgi:hypothetical protein